MINRHLPRIVIFGATGRIGSAIVRRLAQEGCDTLSIGSQVNVLAELPGNHAELSLRRGDIDATLIKDGDVVINAAHAMATADIAKFCPPGISRLIVLGSARCLTRFPDQAADHIRAAVSFLENSSLPWTVLHPTMVYGTEGENNVNRIARAIQQFHVIPLPNFGRSLIQPIHFSDVVECVVRSIDAPNLSGRSIFIGGPEPVSYAQFIRTIAATLQQRVFIVPIPNFVLWALVWLSPKIPFLPKIRMAEAQRLLEDKAIDTAEMRHELKVQPIPLDVGLAEALSPSRPTD